MSRVVFSPANRRILCSILCAPHPLPSPAIPKPCSLALRLQQRLSTRVPRRYGSASAAAAPDPEEEHGSAEVDAQVPENTTPEGKALQAGFSPNGTVDGDRASPTDSPSIPLLPPEVLERIEKKAAQYDEEQAVKALARKERKLERQDRKKRKEMEELLYTQQRTTEIDSRRRMQEYVKSEEAVIEQRTRPAKRNRGSEEVRPALNATKEVNKARVVNGKEALPSWKQKAAEKSLKERPGEMQARRDTLVRTAAAPQQISAVSEAVKEAVATGSIPRSDKARGEPHKDSRAPTQRAEKTSQESFFESPFFSKPTHDASSKSTSTAPRTSRPSTAPRTSNPSTKPRISRPPSRSPQPPPPDSPSWKVQRHALQTKFAETGWNPRRKLSPDAQRGIRDLHASNPKLYTTPVLAETFKVSPEAIRRILRSKWMDKVAGATSTGTGRGKGDALDAAGLGDGAGAGGKMQELRKRWAKRHDKIWDQRSELGLLPKRTSERRVESGERGRRRVEEGLWRDEVLDVARREERGFA